MVYSYWIYLSAASLVFVGLERWQPWRHQSLVRRDFVTDLVYLGFNGQVLALILAPFITRMTFTTNPLVASVLGHSHVSAWPLWAQFLLAFFVIDFIQWGIHNLMHRIPQLWVIHRVHHSIVDMDWLGSMRFHWLEVVVYKSLQYVPLLLLGFHWQVMFWLAVFSTVMGHFNHSNLMVPMGPLRYLLNHPSMHIWHHDEELHHSHGCNFGINLSLWDWLFGTAYMPETAEQPRAIGFAGLKEFPHGFLKQQLIPFDWFQR